MLFKKEGFALQSLFRQEKTISIQRSRKHTPPLRTSFLKALDRLMSVHPQHANQIPFLALPPPIMSLNPGSNTSQRLHPTCRCRWAVPSGEVCIHSADVTGYCFARPDGSNCRWPPRIRHHPSWMQRALLTRNYYNPLPGLGDSRPQLSTSSTLQHDEYTSAQKHVHTAYFNIGGRPIRSLPLAGDIIVGDLAFLPDAVNAPASITFTGQDTVPSIYAEHRYEQLQEMLQDARGLVKAIRTAAQRVENARARIQQIREEIFENGKRRLKQSGKLLDAMDARMRPCRNEGEDSTDEFGTDGGDIYEGQTNEDDMDEGGHDQQVQNKQDHDEPHDERKDEQNYGQNNKQIKASNDQNHNHEDQGDEQSSAEGSDGSRERAGIPQLRALSPFAIRDCPWIISHIEHPPESLRERCEELSQNHI